jgi:hypothetical protein
MDIGGMLITGVGATLFVDGWALLRRRLFGIALPNYALVGRWFGHMARGRFRHAAIAAAAPIRGEAALGWIAHYLIGIAFAAMLLVLFGASWLQRPTLLPALLVGVASVGAPLLLMQPGMGAGIAARHMPRPNAVRLQSLATHVVFGAGLYVAGWIARWMLVA